MLFIGAWQDGRVGFQSGCYTRFCWGTSRQKYNVISICTYMYMCIFFTKENEVNTVILVVDSGFAKACSQDEALLPDQYPRNCGLFYPSA